MEQNQSGLQELLNIAQSSPWLFPKLRTLFPYLGMHNNLDALLRTMSHKSKKIMIIGFSRHWQAMVQNNIFTIVRFTRTSNYIIVTGDELSLLVCIELNLPCYNATSYMLKLQKNVSMEHEATINDAYYLALVWYLFPLYLDILRKGFTIMKSDLDISYAAKDIWKTFELMIEETEADLIFMKENPINTGQFYARPNERVLAFFEEWIDSYRFYQTYNDQQALANMKGKIYQICNSKESCNDVKTLPMHRTSNNTLRINNQTSKMAAVLTYPSSFARYGDLCPPNNTMNSCNQDVLYVHTICLTGAQAKMNKLKELGFWLMADPCTESKLDAPSRSSQLVNVTLIRCVPTPRLRPSVERSFLHCNNSKYAVSLS
ncbi:unnamed protein product [Rotaria sp. Silwood2]|nr:unnamed protein product [Rotaria sp. Silwood2]CAF3123254.1 unnamed protein product [Rotaria sp. Silwood2]CAF3354111.1 unnamed protein product [Rotaria sp. Silwood2]CAF3356295.1 unnamed protein product [Rotaria sp. Silwood2]CAF4039053.1 unnamed protein product [Rotaria sp. Silwood2]